MKKPYQKPNLYVEKFVLAEHIAATCGYSIRDEVTYFDFHECTWNMEELPVFIEANDNCVEWKDSENISITCYDLQITATESNVTIYS